jgi:protein phosphatase
MIYDENTIFEIAVLSDIGDREEQQDSFGYSLKADSGIIAVCDGMGGHQGGKTASSFAVQFMLKEFEEQLDGVDPIDFFVETAKLIDEKIHNTKFDNGLRMNAGTTIVTTIIDNQDLYWLSVGDSRVYIKRNDEFIQVTFDQTYKLALSERLANGTITQDVFDREIKNGAALISYLGVGDLKILDYNNSPFKLQKGDIILLMSDGLYKLVSDEEIKSLIDNFNNIQDILFALKTKAEHNAKNNISKDNITISIVKIK